MLNTSFDSNSVPKYFYDRLTDITAEDIRAMGAKAVALDLDNTSVYDLTLRPLKGAAEWVKKTLDADIPVVILSNSYEWRAKKLSAKFCGIPYIANAEKPAPENYFRAAELAGTDINTLAVIGDQLFTDVQGANGAGAISVRVKYARREIVPGIRFLLLRRREKKYLINAGYGDKV